MASPPHQPMYSSMSQTGTTQTAGARNKGGNFIGQLCISVVRHCACFYQNLYSTGVQPHIFVDLLYLSKCHTN